VFAYGFQAVLIKIDDATILLRARTKKGYDALNKSSTGRLAIVHNSVLMCSHTNGGAGRSSTNHDTPSAEIGELAIAFSLGFDTDAYDRMAADEQRVGQYSKAIRGVVLGKTVLDVGTGRDALLAKLCIAAGAAHVTAVEVVPCVAAEARAAVACAAFAGRLEVLTGHSASISLPKVDLVVHEIVGGLALEEGMASVLLDLQGRPDVVDASQHGWSIPRYVETRVAPLALADTTSVADCCVDSVDRGIVMPWATLERLHVDRLVHIPAPPTTQLLGTLRVLDCLNMEAPLEPQLSQQRDLTWVFDREAMLRGFACAPWLDLDGRHCVDAWLGGTSWPHKLAGLESPIPVGRGDEITLRVDANSRLFPVEYTFVVELRRATTAALVEPLKQLAKAATSGDASEIRQARLVAIAAGASRSEAARVYALHCGVANGK